jgi:hypothetical protein
VANQHVVADALGIAVARRQPVLLWGEPGTGKSSMVRGLALSLGLPLEVVLASLREPADFAGLPVVDAAGTVRLAPPAWATRLVQAGTGLLFLDEITTAAPSVQAALLRVVLERVVGDLALPESVAVVAAANPVESSSGGWDLTPPLANRFCHLDWPVDHGSYVNSLVEGWPPPSVPHLDMVSGFRGAARSNVAGFLRAQPGLVQSLPSESSSTGRAWPSPRSWDMAVDLWDASLTLDATTDVQLVLLSGCVGPGPARELMVWTKEADLPDPEVVLADPGSFRLPDRGDRQFAVLSAVAAAVAADPTVDRWHAGFAVIEQAVKRGAPDVAAVAARALAACAPPDVGELPSSLVALAPVLAGAGILGRRRGRDR